MFDAAFREATVLGFDCVIDDDLGQLSVGHDGSITWDHLQAIKTAVWGAEARAIEVYPRDGDVVNTRPVRHLWRLGAGDWAPDLLGFHRPPDENDEADSLRMRSWRAWREAERAFR